ncbi:substrate-specific component of ECF transporter [Staphylococcus piscifermentans]|uniref:Membrane protein n=1 Tax=Staphylococcus piscifermentans TaxID=70258 RepID=A0A239TM84_9STAP|nr:MptD family putative ECF transporter S component [Staphylococcus piscifermentans]RTX86765.1 MptD family putative ECF transporter S component [Staphylococcus piscifermentans]GEP84492.1 membrane protein [Staphylococcus piscifermentans]SNU97924.1 substrate-specific component of ECF transporter [Staphylococcus piscifermentans]
MQNEKINVKDYINIGVFTAIYIVIFMIVGMMGFIPILLFIYPGAIGLACALPIFILISKTRKFGVLSITAVILTLFMLVTGHPWFGILISLPAGIIGDWIMKLGSYKKWINLLSGYCVFSLWVLGGFAPFFFVRENYFKQLEKGYGKDYVTAISSLFSYEMIPVLILVCVIGAAIGAWISRGLLKKHFTNLVN